MRRLLHNESGVALVMAIVVLAFLALTGATLVYYSSANSGHSEISTDNAKALNLGEAGMNYARSILWTAADPTQSSALPSSATPGELTLEGGTVKYWGAYDSSTKIWTLTGTGTYTNPTGGTAPVSRTVWSQVRVDVTTAAVTANTAWEYMFADTTSQCTNLKNDIEIAAPIYVRGDLCMENSAVVKADLVRVRGKLDIKDTASIGTPTEIVARVEVAGGCRYPWSGAYVTPCGDPQRVYRTDFGSTPPNILKPTIDLAYWYANAKPGPMNPTCTTGSFPGPFDTDMTLDRDNVTTNLFPSSGYDCQVLDGGGNLVGRIAYTPGDPGTFIIHGVVFFDGKIEIAANRNVVYQGRGSIYASDEIKIQNNVKLCGIADCTGSWDPNTNLLALIGGATADSGVLIENYTSFQGAIYAANDYLQKNNVSVCGPIIAEELKIENGSENCYRPFSGLAAGMPGSDTSTTVTLTNVPNGFWTD